MLPFSSGNRMHYRHHGAYRIPQHAKPIDTPLRERGMASGGVVRQHEERYTAEGRLQVPRSTPEDRLRFRIARLSQRQRTLQAWMLSSVKGQWEIFRRQRAGMRPDQVVDVRRAA